MNLFRSQPPPSAKRVKELTTAHCWGILRRYFMASV